MYRAVALAAALLVATACSALPTPTPRPSPTPTLPPETASVIGYVRSLLADRLRAAQLSAWQATQPEPHYWRVTARLGDRLATWHVTSDGTVYPDDALAAELLFGRAPLLAPGGS